MTKIIGDHDKCDNCIQDAQYMVQFITGDLLFCGHHFRTHEAKIMELAVNVYDRDDEVLMASASADIQ